ncbi:MAG: enolase C-terminal domain-like protein [Chloroflexota bacterium]|nr:enolase C-terminal domain-like protein [Chloroflexota bacterium]MQG04482.1 mandelate racemase/muconate lactonizing protein [SAR202 cluster bacterium]|tara:strand:+ start:31142 stop:32338 length:1197 start_codon:yes stop_codon:yes gene_type:complete
MKIEKVELRELSGTLKTENIFWEERLVRPIDIYPDYRAEEFNETKFGRTQEGHEYPISAVFIEIKTDEGVTGIGGPIDMAQAYLIKEQISHLLIGKDPLAIELLWDQMHRFQVHGRQGTPMLALSAIDCALWDLKGKYYDTPVYKLIGGPTREEVPAYASMLGFSVEDLGLVKERAQQFKEMGYVAQKWFFRHGPMSGYEGIKKNVSMVKTLRETLGEEYDIMLDCWQSWDLNYAVKMISRIEEYEPRWLEEVAMPDRIDTYRQVRESTSIPISGAEHEYTRWGFKRFVDEEALDILQPDIYWAGGLSETIKIANYATVHDLITIPHGHSSRAGINFTLTQSPVHTPYQEFLIKWNAIHQFFLKTPINPINGMIGIPSEPGLGMEIDSSKIESEKVIK